MLSSTSDRNSGVLSTRRSMFQCTQAPSDVSSRSSRRIQPNISSFQTARHLQPPKRQPCARASCNAPRGLLVCCQLAACRQSGAGTGGGGESSPLESAWIAMLKACAPDIQFASRMFRFETESNVLDRLPAASGNQCDFVAASWHRRNTETR